MSKFNKNQEKQENRAFTFEGALAYEKNIEDEWLNILFSSFLEDRFYDDGPYNMNDFVSLTEQMIAEKGAEFVACAADFARNELGMRSVAQLTAAILNKYQFKNKRKFYARFPHRVDDVAEVFAAIEMLGDKRSHAAVRGFADYLSTCNSYSLGKYKMKNKQYNLYDIINICHPNSSAISAYMSGLLEPPDTWEVAISTAEDGREREKEWKRLVEEHKLGYLALIRNLNNILSCTNLDYFWIEDVLAPQIENNVAIKTSLVFPFQIYNAYKNIEIKNDIITAALENAFKVAAICNMPWLEGRTAILLDVSGSMDQLISEHSSLTIKEVGAVFATIAIWQGGCDTIKFGTKAKYCDYGLCGSPFHLIEMLQDNEDLGYGTNTDEAYNLLNKPYDRILLVSDMQCYGHPWSIQTKTAYEEYCQDFGKTHLYSFDLGNYHTQTDDPNDDYVHLVTALNESVFKMIPYLESGGSLAQYIMQTRGTSLQSREIPFFLSPLLFCAKVGDFSLHNYFYVL